jgi:hypothetical protein
MEGKQPPLNDYETYNPERPERKPRGCLFYGCVTVAVIGLLVLLLLGAGAYYGYRIAKDFVQEYTEDAPVPVPVVAMPEGERQAVEERVKAFKEALKAGKPAEPLVLTADEINALIAAFPGWKGRVAVDLSGDNIRAEVSIPLESFGFPANVLFPGKYLNGIATLDVRIEKDELVVTIESLEVKGKPVPDDVIKVLRNDNFGLEARNPTNAPMLARIESIVIKDGKLIVTPKPLPVAKPAEAAKKDP